MALRLRLRQHLIFHDWGWVVDLSPDGKHVCLVCRHSKGKCVMRLSDSRVIFKFDGLRDRFWSPDGTKLAIIDPDHCLVLDLKTEQTVQLTTGTNDKLPFLFDCQWSPDAQYLVARASDDLHFDEYIFWKPAVSSTVLTRYTDRKTSTYFKWLRNSEGVVTGSSLAILRPEGHPCCLKNIHPQISSSSYTNISPAGDRAICLQKKKFVIVSCRKNQQQHLEFNSVICALLNICYDIIMNTITWSPSGHQFAYIHYIYNTNNNFSWVVCTKDGDQLHTSCNHHVGFQNYYFTWSPDEQFIALVDNHAKTTIWPAKKKSNTGAIGSVCAHTHTWKMVWLSLAPITSRKKGFCASFYTVDTNNLRIYDIVRWTPHTHAHFTDPVFRHTIFSLMLCTQSSFVPQLPLELWLEVFDHLAAACELK